MLGKGKEGEDTCLQGRLNLSGCSSDWLLTCYPASALFTRTRTHKLHVLALLLFLCSLAPAAEDWTEGLTHARWSHSHFTTFPVLLCVLSDVLIGGGILGLTYVWVSDFPQSYISNPLLSEEKISGWVWWTLEAKASWSWSLRPAWCS